MGNGRSSKDEVLGAARRLLAEDEREFASRRAQARTSWKVIAIVVGCLVLIAAMFLVRVR